MVEDKIIMGALKWKPHAAQQSILQASSSFRFLSLVCGRRFGKTELCLNYLIRKSWEDPGDYVYIAPTLKQAKRIAWRKLKILYPDPFKGEGWKHEGEVYIENLKGGRILLLGADEPDNLRGEGWKGVILDEYADMNPYTFEVILPAIGDHKGFCWFIGTPKGQDHFYEEYIKATDSYDEGYTTFDGQKIKIDPHYKSFKFKTEDNPYYPKDAIDQARERLTDEYFRQEYEASFENYTGLIYKEFLAMKANIVLEPIYKDGQIIGCKKNGKSVIFEKWWNYYHGLDTGRYTAGAFKCMDEKGIEYNFDEIYDIDGICKDISDEIKLKQIGKNMRGNVIDSASQIKNEYRNNGLNYVDSKKDVLGSIEMVRSKMKQGKWFILNNCKAFIKELSSRKWEEKRKIRVGGKRKVTPEDGNDHCCNAEEYIQLTFLHYPVKLKTPKAKSYEESLAYMVQEVHEPTWEEKG